MEINLTIDELLDECDVDVETQGEFTGFFN